MSAQRITRVLLSDSVYETLHRSILTGELKPGDRLRELDLAEQYGTSQAPIREALKREKRALWELLFEDADSVQINQQIREVGELEMRMEKEVISELLLEAEIMAPEERSAFIRSALQRIEGNRKRQQNSPYRPPRRDMRQQPVSDRQKQRRNFQ